MPEEMFKSKLNSRLFTEVPIQTTKTGDSFVPVFRFFSFGLYLLECAHFVQNTAALFSSTKLHYVPLFCVKWPFTVCTYKRSTRHKYWIKMVPTLDGKAAVTTDSSRHIIDKMPC